ncbi:hypothetical protein GUJ93_ZPchr0014g47666 [Zizania palustris]|uniref:DUF1279 domain-containing protein n=1 Tax=Zizania palustris TaxID=103762 RepID=A0A8J5TAZ8_ZIZPA|nr:hypothetical protein GUJ93_ZPchr0014g47666 [Zizania palustris]
MGVVAPLLTNHAVPVGRNHRLLQYRGQQQLLASRAPRPPRGWRLYAVQETKEGEAKTTEEITEKYGLEFGLWKVFSSGEEEGGGVRKKSRTEQAKELLAKYGGAYLATSITLSLISFTLCYLLISAGVDVQDLLGKVSRGNSVYTPSSSALLLVAAAHWRWLLPCSVVVGWNRDGRDRREGGDVRAGLRRAQGGVADQVPADGGADAGGGQLDREDQETKRLIAAIQM